MGQYFKGVLEKSGTTTGSSVTTQGPVRKMQGVTTGMPAASGYSTPASGSPPQPVSGNLPLTPPTL